MAAFSESKTAPIKWAQRSEFCYLTISLADVKDEKIDITEKSFSFEGSSGDQKYTCTFDFFAPIKLEGSVWNTLPNSVQMKLVKEDAEAEFWPRLTTDKVKEKSFVTIDWDKYVDEDEQDGADIDDSALAGGMDMASMMGGGGMPGMGGMGGPGGGMDPAMMAQMMGGMGGGMPGMGGPGGPGGPGGGGMDPAAMAEMMKSMGGMPGGEDDADSDDDGDDLPDLEAST